MKNIRVLDCTLRDGGRIINCEFPDREIREISEKLTNAKIDIIEMGFLRDHRKVNYGGNSTFFTDVDQIRPFINRTKTGTLYVAFIDFGMFDIDSLKPYDGTSVDGIRFGFTKKNYDEAKEEVFRWAHVIKDRGYKLFIQGVNSLNYSDRELLEIVDMVNELEPYSFGIVDTYGAMYMDDVDRLYNLIDHNMLPDICINFHSHNNYQLSFAFAQEVIKLSGSGYRQIIIDSTLGGMGKVAGNLNTELLIDFLGRKLHYDYELEDILDMLDDYIYKYAMEHKWGYSTAAMMAGVYKAHPNNVIYLTEKFRLNTRDIGKLLSMIEPDIRQGYDYNNIESLYTRYVAEKVDDRTAISSLQELMQGKEILVLAPGNTLNIYREIISNYIQNRRPIVISVNFIVPECDSYAFFGNARKYSKYKKQRLGRKVIIASNIKTDTDTDIIVNYHSLINRGYKYFENSAIMLFNLLRRVNPLQITIAGFDGFDQNSEKNYIDNSYQDERFSNEFEILNKEISSMFEEIVAVMFPACKFSMLTPSLYEKAMKKITERG